MKAFYFKGDESHTLLKSDLVIQIEDYCLKCLMISRDFKLK